MVEGCAIIKPATRTTRHDEIERRGIQHTPARGAAPAARAHTAAAAAAAAAVAVACEKYVSDLFAQPFWPSWSLMMVNYSKKTSTSCLWQAPGQRPENQKENQADHSLERAVAGCRPSRSPRVSATLAAAGARIADPTTLLFTHHAHHHHHHTTTTTSRTFPMMRTRIVHSLVISAVSVPVGNAKHHVKHHGISDYPI